MEKPTLVVNISDFKISNNPNDHIVTYSLGSCLGVTVYDSTLKLGGMIHCLLPDSTIGKGKADFNPAMYVDSGLTLMLQKLTELGSNKKKLANQGCRLRRTCFRTDGTLQHRQPKFHYAEKNFMDERIGSQQ